MQPQGALQRLAKAKAVARFHLDEHGRPRSHTGHSARTAYSVQLSVESDNPGLSSVTYRLQHSSYYDPIRESRQKPFEEDFTAYGDFPIIVEVEVESKSYAEKVRLSELLKRGHVEELGKRAIAEAIETIESH